MIPLMPLRARYPSHFGSYEEQFLDANVTLVLASIDEKLNDKSYIVPGLGHAGDRLYDIAH